jgi:TRAP-type C4-dicarboxylate transport system permease large subunit
LAMMVVDLQMSKYLFICIVILLFVALGTFMPEIPLIMLITPVILPTLIGFGFSTIWFGVICVLMVAAGEISPPIGGTLFMTAALAKNVPITTIYRGTTPFLVSIIVVCVFLLIFPQIALFLPQLMQK